MSKGIQKLAGVADWVVAIVGSLIFIWLSWYALRYTQYVEIGGAEIPVNTRDSMIANILFVVGAAAFLLGLFYMDKRISIKMQNVIVKLLLAVAMIWTAVGGFWWITVVKRQPEGDQAYIYGTASMFIEGNYGNLVPGGYCGMYPYQLGLIFLVELLFLIVGTYNYFACQVICVLLAVGIVYLGYRIVWQITEHRMMTAGYLVFSMGCLPLIFYTGWVYGDLPSTFFILLTASCLLGYERTGYVRYLVGVIGAITMAIITRQNSLILLVALCLAGGIYVLVKKDKKLLLALFLSVICPMLLNGAILKMYEIRSGMEIAEGIPMYTHIAMGLQENEGVYGWDSSYSKAVYYGTECDSEVTAEISKEDIGERIKFFIENPIYAGEFFKGKLLSQWNQPMYQSLYFSHKFWPGKEPELVPGSLIEKISGEYQVGIRAFCDRIQFMLYIGMLCYFLFGVRRNGAILQHLLAIGMLGGFLFSIFYEAKARYILPYYLMMYPMAIAGYFFLFKRLKPWVDIGLTKMTKSKKA